MTGYTESRLRDVARQLFAREEWVARHGHPLPDYGLPTVHAYGHDYKPFRAHLGYLLLESHNDGVSTKTGLFFRHDHRHPRAVGPLLQDEQEFMGWAKREYPDRVAVMGDRWAYAPSVALQAFSIPLWRERHPDLAAEADNLRVLMEMGA